SGGTVSNNLLAYNSSTFVMTGGTGEGSLAAFGSSNVRISGGTVDGSLLAIGSSTITIVGSGFAVDGSPVPYGDLAAQTGTLTGTLASGEPIENPFYQGGIYCVGNMCTGTLTLAPPPIRVPALSLAGKLALAVVLMGSVMMLRRRGP
ncbi:MAG: hypothetical protein ACFFEM_17085, partial [Candidatus Thorarchaeota archaeon]